MRRPGPQGHGGGGGSFSCPSNGPCDKQHSVRTFRNEILHHHHHISFTELGHLLTRSSLTYPEVSSKVYHDSFRQLDSNVSLPWVIHFEAFYLHVVSSFSCIPVICPKSVSFLTPLQFVHLFCNLSPSVSCCSSHVFHLCCCYSSAVTCF